MEKTLDTFLEYMNDAHPTVHIHIKRGTVGVLIGVQYENDNAWDVTLCENQAPAVVDIIAQRLECPFKYSTTAIKNTIVLLASQTNNYELSYQEVKPQIANNIYAKNKIEVLLNFIEDNIFNNDDLDNIVVSEYSFADRTIHLPNDTFASQIVNRLMQIIVEKGVEVTVRDVDGNDITDTILPKQLVTFLLNNRATTKPDITDIYFFREHKRR